MTARYALLCLALSLRIHNDDQALFLVANRLKQKAAEQGDASPAALRVVDMVLTSKNPRLLVELTLQGAG